MKSSAPARLAAIATGAAVLVVPTLAATVGPADAAAHDQSLSGASSSMWQTNGNVDTMDVSRGVVYAGGSFTSVRPPGAAAGSQETGRTYLAGFSTSTGAVVSGFNVRLDGPLTDISVSPNGSLLYIAGRFTSVNGVAKSRIAAINLPSGTLNTGFTAVANKAVTAVDANATTLYLGGDFTTVDGVAKNMMASVNATTGALNTGFTTSLDTRPSTIKIAPDNSRVMIGGKFTTVNGAATAANGAPNAGFVSVSPTTGAVQRWDASLSQPINTGCTGRVADIEAQGTTAFVTSEGDLPGCYEGTYSANIADGRMNWNSSCLGASKGLAVIGTVLYRADHQHDCAYNEGDARGGFVGGSFRDAFVHRYLTGMAIADGAFTHWTPQTNATGSQPIGPHVIATDGTQLFAGGDFTRINGVAQQGLTRFAPGNGATPRTPGQNVVADPFPDTVPVVAMNLAVTVTPTRAGTLTVEVPTVEDYDSGTLTYRIYRDNGTTPVSTQTAESFPWSRPVLRFDDAGLAAGSTHSYRVTASDGVHTSARSAAVSGTAPTAAPASLPTVYQGLTPQLWWRLADTGTTAADSGSTGATGTFQGGVTRGAPGAITGNAGVTLNGSTGYVASTRTIAAPTAFSESAWFRTTSTNGGNILSQTDASTGAGGTTDRVISMDNNGGLVFALKAPPTAPPLFGPSTINFRNQGAIWNDGRWHHVVGTYDGTRASLYVDGNLQGSVAGTSFDPTATAVGMPTSFLRAGYADLSQMQVVFGLNYYNRTTPASEHFAGSIDEVAAFSRALTAAQVRSMYAAGVGGGA